MANWRAVLPHVVLILLGLYPRVVAVAHPRDIVWDEVHFVRHANAYSRGRYYFDIHPPHAKIAFHAVSKLFGAGAYTNKELSEGHPWPPGYPHVAVRGFVGLAGGLVPWLLFLLLKAAQLPDRAAWTAGGLALLDSAFLRMSRLVFIDPFVHVFSLVTLLLFLHHRRAEPYSRCWWTTLCLCAAAGGAAFSVKWTGAGVLGAIGMMWVYEAVRNRSWRPLAIRAAAVLLIALPVYVVPFAVHFALLPKSGVGNALMSERFRAGLEGSPESARTDLGPPPGFPEKFAELNRVMWAINRASITPHPNMSKFYHWPLGMKSIPLWGDRGNPHRRIYLVANPVVWWTGTLSVLVAAFLVFVPLRRIAARADWPLRQQALIILGMAYLTCYIPVGYVTRPMFLYHYFTPMFLSLAIAGIVIDMLPWRWVSWALLGAAGVMLLALSPVVFGFQPWWGWLDALLPLPVGG